MGKFKTIKVGLLSGLALAFPVWIWANETEVTLLDGGAEEYVIGAKDSSLTSSSFLGSGTEDDPFLIQSTEDLNQLRIETNGGNTFENQFFLITDDLDFAGFDDDGDTTNGNFTPIGTSTTPFKGSIDGGEHILFNLNIQKSTGETALFQYKTDGYIKRLVLENLKVGPSATRSPAAGLIVYAESTIVEEVGILNGVVTRGGYHNQTVAGLIHEAKKSVIRSSYVQGTMSGQRAVGLVYTSSNSTIEGNYVATMLSETIKPLIYTGSGTIKNNYYDSSLSASAETTYGTPLTTEEFFRMNSNQSLNGFDYSSVWKSHDKNTQRGDYPVFSWQQYKEATVDSGYAGGNGIETNPYQISKPEHFDYLRQQVGNGDDYRGVYFLITENLDFEGFDDDGNSSNGNFTAIGTSATPFKGFLDGGGHVLSNLKLKKTTDNGLFNYLTGATIKRLVLDSINVGVRTTRASLGILANYARSVLVEEVGIVDGIAQRESYNSQHVGGFFYDARASVIRNSYVRANISGQRVAGMVYTANRVTIQNSYAATVLSGIKSSLVNAGSVTTKNNYYDSALNGLSDTSHGTPLTTDELFDMNSDQTLTGFDYQTIWKAHDKESEIKSYPIFSWQQYEKAVADANFEGGMGLDVNPYEIATPEQLDYLRQQVEGGKDYQGFCFLITQDLDFEGFDDDGNASNGNFTPIGTSTTPFKGSIDGGGHTLSNLKLNQNNAHLALFRYKTSGFIKKLILDKMEVGGTTDKYSSSPLIVYAQSTVVEEVGVTNALVKRLQNSAQYASGLIYQATQSTIRNSYTQGTLTGQSAVGLIYTANNSVVENNYVATTMTGPSGKKAIIYAGSGNTVNRNYYDSSLNGLTETDYGTPLTTEEFFKMNSEQTLEGFDYSTIWKPHDATSEIGSYPLFSWQAYEKAIFDTNYAGGNGLEMNPYQISEPEHLNYLREQVESGKDYRGAYFLITKNLDFKEFDDDGNESNGNFTPIGTVDTPFKGSIDGGENKLSNLKIIRNHEDIALFRYKTGGYIKKLMLDNIELQGTTDSNVSSSLIVYAQSVLVEEVGVTNALVERKQNSGQVVSGLIHQAIQSTIQNSYVRGELIGREVAGLIYRANHSIIENNYVATTMTGSTGKKAIVYTTSGNTLTHNYYDSTLSGLTEASDGLSLTTEEFFEKNAKGELEGFDYDAIWQTNKGYPQFVWGPREVNVTVKGNVEPTILNVLVPTQPVEFILNPNQLPSLISPQITLTSTTHAPIQVFVQSFEQVEGSMIDVSPNRYTDEEWRILGKADSKSWALGIKNLASDKPIYVAEVTDSVPLGIIKKDMPLSFEFVAKHGHSFAEDLTLTYQLVFLFELLP